MNRSDDYSRLVIAPQLDGDWYSKSLGSAWENSFEDKPDFASQNISSSSSCTKMTGPIIVSLSETLFLRQQSFTELIGSLVEHWTSLHHWKPLQR